MTTSKILVHASLLVSLGALGCGGDADLDPAAVQSVPPGDASGTSFSGSYGIERHTTGCRGACGPFNVGVFVVSICDIGDTDAETVDVTQENGAIEFDLSDVPARYRGGVDADGSFDVGAYATQYGGSLEIAVRVDGVIGPSGINGRARARTWGRIDGQGVDCYGDHEIRPD